MDANMKIKQTTFCAMRILWRIHQEQKKVVTSKEIAEREEASTGVTLKILRELSRAGILHVHQGRGQVCGGFSLAKSIDDIKMVNVIVALEGLDIGVNLDEASRGKEKNLDRTCNQINEHLEELFSKYSIRYLFEPDEQGIV